MTWFADVSPCTCLPMGDTDSVRAVGWLESEIDSFIAGLIAERDANEQEG